MGLGTWRSNSQQSFATGGNGRAGVWGAVNAPGDDDWSLEGTHMRALGQGIEGGSRNKKGKGRESDTAKMRAVGLGIEGRPRSHSRKPSSSSTMKGPASHSHDGSDPNGESEGFSVEDVEDMRRQNVQTTLALLQTFHANTVFWLSKLREAIPPPSAVSTPGFGARGLSGINDEDTDIEPETVTITARDLLALELGVLSELDAKFIEWLTEAEGYASAESSSLASAQPGSRRRRVVVKRGWQELLGIMFGLK